MTGRGGGAKGAGLKERKKLLAAWPEELLRRPMGLRDLGSIALETARLRGLVPEDDSAGATATLLAVGLLALLALGEALDAPVEAEAGLILAALLERGSEP